MDVTTIVAWYGAVASTVGIALKALDLYRDSARLKVKIEAEDMIEEYDNYIATVQNVGRRTVTIERIHLGTPDNYGFSMDDDLLPLELHEGKSATFKIYKKGLKPEQIEYLMVVDAADRIWTGKFKR